MTDLLIVLPDFSIKPFSNLLPSLEKAQITVADVLASDALDIARRAGLPAREVRRLTDALLHALHGQLGSPDMVQSVDGDAESRVESKQLTNGVFRSSGPSLDRSWQTISTLDAGIDAALNGGIPAGYITEITGERYEQEVSKYSSFTHIYDSGVGKTHFLLTLLLAVQLPLPIGLHRSALYISTEAPLQTTRLSQMLASHSQLQELHADDRPSFTRILSIQTPDLESQEHILRYQVPVAICRHNIGLLVIDSITSNFRAEFDPSAKTSGGTGPSRSNSGAVFAQRSGQLLALGALLRDIARSHNIAVVVANQVADRFTPDLFQPPSSTPAQHRQPPSSNPTSLQIHQPQTPMRPRSPLPPSASAPNPDSYAFPRVDTPNPSMQTQDYPLTITHQQRFFSGWGDLPPMFRHVAHNQNLKTPSLGLVWTNQLGCRIALMKTQGARPNAAAMTSVRVKDGGRDDYELLSKEGGEEGASRWRRWCRIAFCAWAPSVDGERGVEVEIGREGLRSVVP
jgi:DNA repair protein RAD57